MPKAKRPAIDYPAQFGVGVFRPKEVVEHDLAVAEGITTPLSTPVAPPTQNRTNDRSNERTTVRHSFDIRQDQLIALTQIQTELFNETRQKPKLGTLVQEALDRYIAQHKKRKNERTFERTNDRSRG